LTLGTFAVDSIVEMGDCQVQLVPDDVGSKDLDKEVTVLVTGYGPFLKHAPVNASWSVTSSLPDSLPKTATCPRIRLVKYPHPLKVAYATVLDVVPKLLSADDKPDIVLHIGLAAGRKYFTLERQSSRAPYSNLHDVDGHSLSDEFTETMWPSATFPQHLKPTFDVEDVWRRWRSNVINPDTDIRPSDDPGTFLCGFIYYLSMSWYWKKQAEERPVMFLHVPNLPKDEDIEEGRTVALGLIRALVESRERVGIKDPLKPVKDQAMGAAEIQLGRDQDENRWDGIS